METSKALPPITRVIKYTLIDPGKARHIGTFALLSYNLRVMGATSRSYTPETGQPIRNTVAEGASLRRAHTAISALLKDFTGAKMARIG